MFGVKIQGGAKTLLSLVQTTRLELRRSQPEPALDHRRLKECKTAKLFNCGGHITLLKMEAAEVVADNAQLVIKGQCGPVAPDRGFHLAAAVVGEAEIIPRQGVLGKQGGGPFQRGHGVTRTALFDQFLALQQCGRTGWSAANKRKATHRQQQTKRLVHAAISIGQHRGWC